MICKLDNILKVFIVLALLAVRYTTSSPTENEQKGELKEQMNELKSYMEALHAENNKLASTFIDLKTENEEIKSDVNKLKAQVYSQDQQNILLKRKIANLELLLPPTLESYANNMSMENGFSKMDELILPPSSCQDIGMLTWNQDQRALNGIHLVKKPTSNKIEAVFCTFNSKNVAESEELMGYVEVNDGKPNSRPTSCADLWARGNTVPNFYMIQNGNKIWAVYCDFTNGISEKSIGNLEMNDGITNARPTSCDMLWDLGNTVPNFYMIQKDNKIKTVFCDFTKQTENTNIESFVGNMEMNDGKTNSIPTNCDMLWDLGNTVPNFYMIKKDGKIKTVYCDFTKQAGNTESFVGNMEMNDGKTNSAPTSCDDLWKLGNTIPNYYMTQKDNKIKTVFCDFTKQSGNTESFVGNMEMNDGKTNLTPTSCDDLWALGNAVPNFYMIKKGGKIQIVYCDFTNGNREKAIGYNDIKTDSGVYFYVMYLNWENLGTMMWQNVATNIGNGFNINNGKFTAPVDGIYFFQVNVLKDNDGPEMHFKLLKETSDGKYDDAEMGWMFSDSPSIELFGAISATIELKKGNTIRVVNSDNNTNKRAGHFMGYLLEQLNVVN